MLRFFSSKCFLHVTHEYSIKDDNKSLLKNELRMIITSK